MRTGVLTAGAAILFGPAAPVLLLMKGKDVTVITLGPAGADVESE